MKSPFQTFLQPNRCYFAHQLKNSRTQQQLFQIFLNPNPYYLNPIFTQELKNYPLKKGSTNTVQKQWLRLFSV